MWPSHMQIKSIIFVPLWLLIAVYLPSFVLGEYQLE